MHYIRFGSGTRYLLAFHGFGDRAELFLKLQSLQEHYTVIAFDLPFHGATQWPDSLFHPQSIKAEIDRVLEAEGIEKFSMICHSMGGRFVLALSPFYAARIEGLLMLSPAGFQGTLSDSHWLFPLFIRRLYKWLTGNALFTVGLLKIGRRLGIINKGTYVFLEQQMSRDERRRRLFDCWISLYHFPIQLQAFKALVLLHQIPLVFFYGNSDYITPAKYAKRFIADMPEAQLLLVQDGHYFLREPLDEALGQLLGSNWGQTIAQTEKKP